MLQHKSLYLNSFVKVKSNNTFFMYAAQSFMVACLFNKNIPDWFISNGYEKDLDGNKIDSPFINFIEQNKNWDNKSRKPKPKYYDSFENLTFSNRYVKSKLAHNSYSDQDNTIEDNYCHLEAMSCVPNNKVLNNEHLPGHGKHIIYFTGINICYQQLFSDISSIAKETGATVHAFNYPGVSGSTGVIRESNDLINSGMSMVYDLISQGIDSTDIILQGDCNGSAVAYDVKRILNNKNNFKLRVIISCFIPGAIKHLISFMVSYTGWDLSPCTIREEAKEEVYSKMTNEQCHIYHIGDKALPTGSLSDAVKTPFDFNSNSKIDSLYSSHKVKVKDSKRIIHAKKQKVSEDEIDTHLIPLCDFELNDDSKLSAYAGFVNKFLEISNEYIAKSLSDNRASSSLSC